MKKCFKYFFIITVLFFSSFLYSTPSIAQANSTTTFETFSQELLSILNSQSNQASKIVIDSNDLIFENNTYYISAEKFATITNTSLSTKESSLTLNYNNISIEIASDYIVTNNITYDLQSSLSLHNTTTLIPLEQVSTLLGFESSLNHNNFILYRPYGSKRLIVKSLRSIDSQGAIMTADDKNGLHIFQYSSEEETISAKKYFESLECVEYVDIDTLLSVAESSEEERKYYSWGAKAIGADEYIKYLNNISTTLPEIIVAVLDTGIDSDHSWFKNRIAEGAAGFATNSAEKTENYEDGHGHGTHVSGTIVDLTLDNVKILPIKVMMDNGTGWLSSIVTGINYVSTLKSQGRNIYAINMSIGTEDCPVGSDSYNSFKAAIDNAYANNILSVVASGNENINADTCSPANIESAITVAAVGESNNNYYKAKFSNYGQFIDICAPGVGINSAWIGGGVATKNGTSMATPHIAAAVALIYSNKPNHTPQEVEDILFANVIDLGVSGKDSYFGYGLCNITYAYCDIIDEVIFSVTETSHNSPFTLSLSSIPLADIYYTLDGTTPTTSSILYDSPITITNTAIVTAKAFVQNNDRIVASSTAKSITYTINGEDIDNAYVINEEGVLLVYNGILTDIIVPSSYKGKSITSIGENAFTHTKVVSVQLSTSITNINAYAFSDCITLQSIIAPNVTTIGDQGFSNCISLKTLDNSSFPVLETIGKFAFLNCYNIETLNLNNVELIDYAAFYMDTYTPTELTQITFTKAKTIGAEAFANFSSITEISLPNAEVICSGAFYNCNINEVSLPKAQLLGNGAFYINDNLTSADLPNAEFIGNSCFYNEEENSLLNVNIPKVKTIGGSAFALSKIITIYLPEVLYIRQSAFSKCSALTNISMPKLREVGNYAFSYTNLQEVYTPEIEYLEEYSFGNCTGLKKVTLSHNLVKINDNSFYNHNKDCNFYMYSNSPAKQFARNNNITYTDLSNSSIFKYEVLNNSEICLTGLNSTPTEEIIIPSYLIGLPVTKIGDNAFIDCEYITSINSDNLKIIGKNAFRNCSNLISIILNNLLDIENNAFENCINLATVEINSIERIRTQAFVNCPKLLSINLTQSILLLEDYSLGFNSNLNTIDNFIIYGYKDSEAEYYSTYNNIDFYSRMVNLPSFYYTEYENNDELEIAIVYVDTQLTGRISIPSSYDNLTISMLDNSAFANCCFIEEIKIPSSIKYIGDNCFNGCTSLTSITLPEVVKIGDEAFKNCIALKEIYLPKIQEIGASVFENTNLSKIVIGKRLKSYTNYTIPRSATIYSYTGLVAYSYVLSHFGWNFVNIRDLDITQNLDTSINIYPEDDLTLSIENSGFEYKYQWYLSTDLDSEGVAIKGENKQSLDLDTSTIGTYYYYVKITNWDNTVATSNICKVRVQEKFDIHVSSNEFGQVSPNGTTTVTEGDSLSILITPDTGYHIKNIIINNTPLSQVELDKILDSIIIENIYENKDVFVEFEINQYSINSTPSINGNINIKNDSVNYGSSTNITFTPDKNYCLSQLIIDGEIISEEDLLDIEANGYTFSEITSDHTIEAVFEIIKYSINAGTIGVGNITDNGTIAVEIGSNKTYIITPNIGYIIKDVKVDGDSVGAVDSYTFENITSDHNITAEFELKKFNVSIKTSGNGKGIVKTQNSLDYVQYGKSITFVITPEFSSEISQILINGEIVDSTSSNYTISNVKQDISIEVVFSPTEPGTILGINSSILILIILGSILGISFILIAIKLIKSSKRR